MKRLTERDEFGNADITNVDMAELQLNLNFEEMNRVTDALNKLATYEDTGLTPDEINSLQEQAADLKRRMEEYNHRFCPKCGSKLEDRTHE